MAHKPKPPRERAARAGFCVSAKALPQPALTRRAFSLHHSFLCFRYTPSPFRIEG